MRFNELISGVRSDVAVKVYGDDLDTLLALGERDRGDSRRRRGRRRRGARADDGLADAHGRSRGARVLARYGLDVADVQDVVATAIGGEAVGPGVRRRPALRSRDPAARAAAQRSRDARGAAGAAARRRLRAAARARRRSTIVEGPNAINRENGKRRVVVTANVRGRDLGSFVADARAAYRSRTSSCRPAIGSSTAARSSS